jgi:DNA-binding winged helix-turn-helix (wHTH) protein
MPGTFAFGEFVLDADQRRLLRGSRSIPLPPKTFDVLHALVRHTNALVSKRQLLQIVWPDTFVEERILTVYIAAIRRALGDRARRPRYVETVARHGYRFVAGVKTVDDSSSASASRHSATANNLVEIGRRHLLDGSYASLEQAIEAFGGAIAADDTTATGYAYLAVARCAQAQVRAIDARGAYEQAKVAALRALALDNGQAQAQFALGSVLLLSEWDWVGAERSLRRALTNDPSYTEAYLRYGNLLDANGRLTEGLEMKRRALEYSPDSPAVLTEIAISYFLQRKYDNVIAFGQQVLVRNPANHLACSVVALSHWYKGDTAAFVAVLLKRAEAVGRPIQGPVDRATIVRRLLDESELPPADGSCAIRRASVMANLGDPTAAFRHLDDAMAVRDPSVIYLAVSPMWDPLRGDPRFDERLAQLRLPTTTSRGSLDAEVSRSAKGTPSSPAWFRA